MASKYGKLLYSLNICISRLGSSLKRQKRHTTVTDLAILPVLHGVASHYSCMFHQIFLHVTICLHISMNYMYEQKKNKKKNKKKTKKKSPPSLFPISYFPISYDEQIFQILFLLFMYFIAIAKDCLISPHWLAAFPAGDID